MTGFRQGLLRRFKRAERIVLARVVPVTLFSLSILKIDEELRELCTAAMPYRLYGLKRIRAYVLGRHLLKRMDFALSRVGAVLSSGRPNSDLRDAISTFREIAVRRARADRILGFPPELRNSFRALGSEFFDLEQKADELHGAAYRMRDAARALRSFRLT